MKWHLEKILWVKTKLRRAALGEDIRELKFLCPVRSFQMFLNSQYQPDALYPQTCQELGSGITVKVLQNYSNLG